MVVAGLRSADERKQEAQRLLDWGFRLFRPVDVFARGERVGRAKVWGGSQRYVELASAADLRVALSPQEQEIAEVKLSYIGPLMAPLAAGQPVGQLRLMVDGLNLAEVPVVAADDVASRQSMWSRALDSLYIMIFGS
jgi:D-alanyl-D-alanine carboxypeptidase (penicillin-binding protein 5/6)